MVPVAIVLSVLTVAVWGLLISTIWESPEERAATRDNAAYGILLAVGLASMCCSSWWTVLGWQ